jgi:hypothetical protein
MSELQGLLRPDECNRQRVHARHGVISDAA